MHISCRAPGVHKFYLTDSDYLDQLSPVILPLSSMSMPSLAGCPAIPHAHHVAQNGKHETGTQANSNSRTVTVNPVGRPTIFRYRQRLLRLGHANRQAVKTQVLDGLSCSNALEEKLTSSAP